MSNSSAGACPFTLPMPTTVWSHRSARTPYVEEYYEEDSIYSPSERREIVHRWGPLPSADAGRKIALGDEPAFAYPAPPALGLIEMEMLDALAYRPEAFRTPQHCGGTNGSITSGALYHLVLNGLAEMTHHSLTPIAGMAAYPKPGLFERGKGSRRFRITKAGLAYLAKRARPRSGGRQRKGLPISWLMKLRIISDLHLEFDPGWKLRPRGEDAVLCAGDISSAKAWGAAVALIKSCRVPFYYTPGNHDLYHGEPSIVLRRMRALEREFPFFRCLVNETTDLGGYLLAGTPLWTDFSLYGPGTVQRSIDVADDTINDFRLTRVIPRRWLGPSPENTPMNRTRLLRPRDLRGWNFLARRFLRSAVALGRPMIVMSHWCPSAQTISPGFAGHPANPYFTTECSDLMGKNVALWVHGHSHAPFDGFIRGTRVLRNPKGYPEERSGWNPDLVIEVP